MSATLRASAPALRIVGVSRIFRGPVSTVALDGVDIDINRGEFVAIVGPSGCGKSTLLNIAGLLDTPTSGAVLVDGTDTADRSRGDRARLRSDRFGYVFQSFHLLNHRPSVDSVELSLLYRAVPRRERRERAHDALSSVGLAASAAQRPALLSGGQRQRVAIARALASGADIIIADEPTGNLDSTNGALVLEALQTLRDSGRAVLLVTHDLELAAKADRIVHVRDGRVVRVEHLAHGTAMPRTLASSAEQHRGSAMAFSALAEAAPGGASRLRFGDMLQDAARNVGSRLGRTLGLAGAVATAVGLAIASLGIANSASAQVSDRFDRHANRDVSLTLSHTPEQPAPVDLVSAGRRHVRGAREVSGVDAASVLFRRGSTFIQATDARRIIQVAASSAVGDLERSTRSTITWLPHHPHRLLDGEVLIGANLARSIDLGPLSAAPKVTVQGLDVPVAGIITAAHRLPSLLGEVLTNGGPSITLEPPAETVILLRTASGAAQQVAHFAAPAIDPFAPASFRVDAPRDPTTLRAEVESDVRTTLLAFTLIAVLAATVALGNAMVLSVLERRAEIGVRRAVGARPAHIAGMVLSESAIIGAAGGLTGLALGSGAVLAITIAQGWIPVFNLTLAPLAILGGIGVGCLGGLIAASRAVRIEPQEALRT